MQEAHISLKDKELSTVHTLEDLILEGHINWATAASEFRAEFGASVSYMIVMGYIALWRKAEKDRS